MASCSGQKRTLNWSARESRHSPALSQRADQTAPSSSPRYSLCPRTAALYFRHSHQHCTLCRPCHRFGRENDSKSAQFSKERRVLVEALAAYKALCPSSSPYADPLQQASSERAELSEAVGTSSDKACPADDAGEIATPAACHDRVPQLPGQAMDVEPTDQPAASDELQTITDTAVVSREPPKAATTPDKTAGGTISEQGIHSPSVDFKFEEFDDDTDAPGAAVSPAGCTPMTAIKRPRDECAAASSTDTEAASKFAAEGKAALEKKARISPEQATDPGQGVDELRAANAIAAAAEHGCVPIKLGSAELSAATSSTIPLEPAVIPADGSMTP